MTRRALFILTNITQFGAHPRSTGFDVREAAGLWFALTNRDIEVIFSSPRGGRCRPIEPRTHTKATRAFFESPAAWIAATEDSSPLRQIDGAEFCLIYLVGGHGAMWDFWPSVAVRTIVQDATRSGAHVAAICHGVAGLLNMVDPNDSTSISTQRVTAFSDEEERRRELLPLLPFSLEQKLREAGAIYSALPDMSSHVVSDGPFVTAQNPYSVDEFSRLVTSIVFSDYR